jgi:hypothetical protein
MAALERGQKISGFMGMTAVGRTAAFANDRLSWPVGNRSLTVHQNIDMNRQSLPKAFTRKLSAPMNPRAAMMPVPPYRPCRQNHDLSPCLVQACKRQPQKTSRQKRYQPRQESHSQPVDQGERPMAGYFCFRTHNHFQEDQDRPYRTIEICLVAIYATLFSYAFTLCQNSSSLCSLPIGQCRGQQTALNTA